MNELFDVVQVDTPTTIYHAGIYASVVKTASEVRIRYIGAVKERHGYCSKFLRALETYVRVHGMSIIVEYVVSAHLESHLLNHGYFRTGESSEGPYDYIYWGL